MTETTGIDRVLVIKLGALGDFLLALGPMQAIRRHHPSARITLLTRPAYRTLAAASGLFDEIWDDPTPRLNPVAWLELRTRLRGGRFQRVYDLQTSDRSAAYFRLLGPRPVPEWSGKVAGCSHRHVYPAPNTAHTIDRQRAQLAVAGIDDVALADLSFLDGDVSALAPRGAYALLIPGASATRPAKRWPVARYGDLAGQLATCGLAIVIAGTEIERPLAAAIAEQVPDAVDATGRTDLAALAALARGARLVVGNDTGPTHLAALTGAPTLTLFSADSDPHRTAPRGPATRMLTSRILSGLAVDTVMSEIADWINQDPAHHQPVEEKS